MKLKSIKHMKNWCRLIWKKETNIFFISVTRYILHTSEICVILEILESFIVGPEKGIVVDMFSQTSQVIF